MFGRARYEAALTQHRQERTRRETACIAATTNRAPSAPHAASSPRAAAKRMKSKDSNEDFESGVDEDCAHGKA
jgi:hypothetical protein